MSVRNGQTITVKDGNLFAQNLFPHFLGVKFVRELYSDCPAIVGFTGTTLRVHLIEDELYQSYDIGASEWLTVQALRSVVILGNYIYLLAVDDTGDPDEHRIYRFAKTNMAAGATVMTFSGAVVLTNVNKLLAMSSDGTNIYINFAAGTDSTNDYKLAKYSISGTVLTYVSTITCGSTVDSVRQFFVQSDGDVVAISDDLATLRRFNSSGTIQNTVTISTTSGVKAMAYYNDFFFYKGYEFSGGSANQVLARTPTP